jgi:hypothetical protein
VRWCSTYDGRTQGCEDRRSGSVIVPIGDPRDCDDVPRTVRVIEHTLIPSKDGTTLAARKI